MKNSISKALTALTMLGAVSALPACTDGELAAGIGGLAVGAIVGSASSSNETHVYHHRERRCSPTYRERCTEYRDHWGHWRRECRQEYAGCFHEIVGTGPLVTNEDIAEKFGLSYSGADKLMASLKEAQKGNLQALTSLGFSREDLQNMAKFSMPGDSAIDGLAKNLNQDPSATRDMVEKVLETARLQNAEKSEQN